MMGIRKCLLLYAIGACLGVWGTYVISHIDSIIVGQRWTVTFLIGLIIGAFPLIIGAFLMAIVIVYVGMQLLAKVRSEGWRGPSKEKESRSERS